MQKTAQTKLTNGNKKRFSIEKNFRITQQVKQSHFHAAAVVMDAREHSLSASSSIDVKITIFLHCEYLHFTQKLSKNLILINK